MQIVDLNEDLKKLYFICLEDWSDEVKDAGNHKEKWFNDMSEKGLRVKIALDENGNAGGMIQYAPGEYSIIKGSGLYFIYCIWVHGHKQGRGNLQKKGMGRALLQAAEEDARNLGAKGISAWGLSLPFWMKASWFKKRGYKAADKSGISLLMWKPFTGDAVLPQWIKPARKPEAVKEKVTVTAFVNGWCMAQNLVFERARKAALEFDDRVVFKEILTNNPETLNEWGISDGLFIDGKQVNTGPPPSYEKIRKMIEKKVKKLRL